MDYQMATTHVTTVTDFIRSLFNLHPQFMQQPLDKLL